MLQEIHICNEKTYTWLKQTICQHLFSNAGACYVNLLIMLTDQPEINAKILSRYKKIFFLTQKVFTVV